MIQYIKIIKLYALYQTNSTMKTVDYVNAKDVSTKECLASCCDPHSVLTTSIWGRLKPLMLLLVLLWLLVANFLGWL